MNFNWWLRWPEQYAWEKEEFARFGAAVSEVSASNGLLILRVEWPIAEGEVLALEVRFSPHHPSCPPRVLAPELADKLGRHVDPSSGGLCLLVDGGGQWSPQQSVAELIAEQLPKVLMANTDRDEGHHERAAHIEENAPDPLSAYYNHVCERVSAAFFDGDRARIPGAKKFGLCEFRIQNRNRANPPAVEFYLDKVNDASGRRLSTMQKKWLPHGQLTAFEGLWVRLDMPRWSSVDVLYDSAIRELKKRATLQPAFLSKLTQESTKSPSILAILFDDEVNYDGDRIGDSWFFIVTRRGSNGAWTHNLIRPNRLTADIVSRSPIAHELADKDVVVLGVGAIGSFVAAELVRAGVRSIRIVDGDYVEPGNSVRWILGQTVWGMSKVDALVNHLAFNFPRTSIVGENRTIGYPESFEGKDITDNAYQHDYEIVSKADIVIDTTASSDVHLAMSSLCSLAKTNYIMAYATEGAVGGVIFYQPASNDSCYICLQEHWVANSLPVPPVKPDSSVVLVGCNSPAFTGAAFDLQEISISTVRQAANVLRNSKSGVGEATLFVLELNAPVPTALPNWSIEPVRPACPSCKAKVA